MQDLAFIIFIDRQLIMYSFRKEDFLSFCPSSAILTRIANVAMFLVRLKQAYYTPTNRVGAILQSPCPSVHTFVTDISASTGRNDFIFDIWLWHGDLYHVSPFQV